MPSYKLGYKYMYPEVTDAEIEMIDAKADEFLDEAREKFDRWLDENGYENVMGMIVKKGEVADEQKA